MRSKHPFGLSWFFLIVCKLFSTFRFERIQHISFFRSGASRFGDYRDKKLTLHIRHRRWLSAEGKSIILNIYPLVADGTRYSAEFAAFLKEGIGYDPGDGTLPW